MRPTFCTRLMFLLAVASYTVCEYSASRVVSANQVRRARALPKSFSALNSAVQERSGFRLGSLMYCELVVEVAPYSSATVGKRTARASAALGDAACTERSA